MVSLGSGTDPGATSVRVIIVDNQPIIRIGLRAILELAADLMVMGEADDFESAVALAEAVQPDVALVDVNLPHVDGFETAAAILKVSSPTRVAMISGAFDAGALQRGAGIGVRGFILKSESTHRLAVIVREIHLGGLCYSEGVCTTASAGSDDHRGAAVERSRLQSLDSRELAMLIQLAKGASLKEAARVIGISYKSADRVKQRVMQKLDIHDRVEIARFAIREGLIS